MNKRYSLTDGFCLLYYFFIMNNIVYFTTNKLGYILS